MGRRIATALGLGLLLTTVALAAEMPEVTPKVTDVTVFKDGHALVMAKGSVELRDGWCRTREVPAPVLGTFWTFVTDPAAKVDFVRAGFVETTETVPCLTFAQMIQANKGKEATLVEQPKDAPPITHTGTLRGILEHEGEREVPVTRNQPSRRDRWGNYTGNVNVTETSEAPFKSQASFVMLETKDGMALIQLVDVRSISLADKAPATTRTDTKKVREISIRVTAKGGPASGKHEVGMVYLQKGIRWIPDYRIELLEGGKAKVSLHGTLINELADLENVTVRLVVGVPSFVMKDTLSPLALRDVALRLSSYFQPPTSAGPGGGVDYLSNAMMSQAAAPMPQPGEAVGGGPNVPIEGQQEDLFLYEQKGITLKKGESAAIDLMEVTVAYEDIYVWEIAALPPMEMWRHVNRDQQQQLVKSLTGARAMHNLRLKNTGKQPWTTGPALIFKGGTPLGQQLLSYTSVGNEVDVPVTIATDLNTKKEDAETGRVPNAIRIDGEQYTKVSLKGKLTVTNFKDRPVRITVKRSVVGTITEATHEGKVLAANALEEDALGMSDYPWYWWGWPWWWLRANSVSLVSWDTMVPAGKPIALEYDYHYYARP